MIESAIAYHILCNLVHSEVYCREVIAHIKPDYFLHKAKKVICEEIIKFHSEYNKPPSVNELAVEIENRRDVTEDVSKDIDELLESIVKKSDVEYRWLYNQTEEFCKKQEVFNALQTSISIYENETKGKSLGEIPDILRDALSVSFDKSVGSDYFEDGDVYDYLHKREGKLSFNLEEFNKITRGGLSRKTLNVVVAGTGIGKTMFMVDFAAHTLMQGKNIVYFTMEMGEKEIITRLHANLMDLPIPELREIDRDIFNEKREEIRKGTKGNLIIKEYETGEARCGHFRACLDELKFKKQIIPDLIVVDYLNICAPQKGSGKDDLYSRNKFIAEELRALAVQYDLPLLTAVQFNREGFRNSNPGLENVAESFGISATADFVWALISSEKLEEDKQIMVKQLKNRYNDLNYINKFVIQVDRNKMKFSNAPDNADTGIK